MSKTPVQSVVPLTEEDESELQQLLEACPDYLVLLTGAGPDPDEAVQLLTALPPGVSRSQKLVLGVRRKDEGLLAVADVVRAYPHEDTWYIGELIVAPQVRTLGLGRTLYDVVRRRAEAAGAIHIELAVHEGNTDALGFWSRMGFHETGRKKHQLKNLESTFVLMRTTLQSRSA